MKIRLENISKSFEEKNVLRDISFVFEEGRIYLLSGESGSGKSTLLSLLAGLALPDSGSIFYEDGQKMTEVNSGTKPRRLPYQLPDMSMVFQEDRLLPDRTAFENIKIFCDGANPTEIREMIRELLPEDAAEKKISEYSGGMKRRVALIRALMRKGKVLLLDEPFNGLDPGNTKKAFQLINEKRGDRIVVMASHIQNINCISEYGDTKKTVHFHNINLTLM